MNKTIIKRDIYKTLKKDIIESFNVVSKGSEIRKQLKEQEYPFAFEVPFVLRDDLESIIEELNKPGYGIDPSNYILQFKDGSNTLIIRSKDQITNDTLMTVINNVQIYGTAENPLGPQVITDNDEEQNSEPAEEINPLKKDIQSAITGGGICPVCGEMNTKLVNENIGQCPICYSIWEAKVCKEDMLIEPKKVSDIEGDDSNEKQPPDAPVKAVIEKKNKRKRTKSKKNV